MSKYARIIDIEKLLYRKGFCIGKTPDELYEALSDLPTIEVSDDAISRRNLLNKIDAHLIGSQQVSHMKSIIRNEPSVVPSIEDGKWVGMCSFWSTNERTEE